jgi:hypothetical protein
MKDLIKIKILNKELYKKIKKQPKNIQKGLIKIYMEELTHPQTGGSSDSSVERELPSEMKFINERIREKINKLNEIVVMMRNNKSLQGYGAPIEQQLQNMCNPQHLQNYMHNFLVVRESLNAYANKIKLLQGKNNKADKFLTRYGVLDNKLTDNNSSYLSTFTEDDLNKLDCSQDSYVTTQINKVHQLLDSGYFKDEYKELQNLYEDVTGTMKVMVNIYNKKETSISSVHVLNENGKVYITQDQQCNTTNEYDDQDNTKDGKRLFPFKPRFGPFYAAFENGQDYSETMKQLTIQFLQRKKPTVFFNYGISGSGKSFAMYGNNSNGNIFTFYDTIREIYPNATITVSVNEVYGQIELLQDHSVPNESITTESLVNQVNIKDRTEITKLIADINNQRIANKMIKPTVNNPQSSRSHLLFDFSVFDGTSTTQAIFIDSAGIEDAIDMSKRMVHVRFSKFATFTKDTFYQFISKVTGGTSTKITTKFWKKEWIDIIKDSLDTKALFIVPDSINPEYYDIIVERMDTKLTDKMRVAIAIKQNQKTNSAFVTLYALFLQSMGYIFDTSKQLEGQIVDILWSIMGESFYITETINHLKYYLQNLIGKKIQEPSLIKVTQITQDVVQADYNTSKCFYKYQPNEQFGIFSYLNPNVSYKFVLMLSLRDDKCIETAKTLMLAEALSSGI